MGKNTNEWFGPVLSKYNLQPEFIESYGNVKKIVTKNGIFALKFLKDKNQTHFIQLMEHLYQKGYTRIAPVFKTSAGQSFVFHQNQCYYLMPWCQNELNGDSSVHHNRMIRELARLHYVSTEKIPLLQAELTKTYENVSNDWHRKITFLEAYIDKCEKKRYMSPFELQFCTIFHETMQAMNFAKSQLKKWFELMKEKTDARVVINHGKVSCQHFVYDQNGNGLFIGFEKAKFALPIYDLVRYYHNVLMTYPIKCDECKNYFFHYQNHFPYTDEEKMLFFSYLVFPEQIYRTVNKYLQDKQTTEQQFVSQLQKGYWQLKNIEYVVMIILEEEKTSEQEDEGTASSGPM